MKKKKRVDITKDDIIDVRPGSIPKNSYSNGPELDIYEDEEEKINEYYVKLSYRFRIAKFVSLTLCIVFVLCMLTAFSEDITAENFRYLMKDINFELPENVSEFGNISYTEDTEAVYAMFKNDLVCVGRNSIEVVDMSGDTVLKEDISYVKPRISAGKKYFLVYDLSGYSFSVYNSFSCIYSETLDYPISYAYVNDDGRAVVVTRSEDYRCCVLVYNKKYELAYTWKTNDKYVFDVVLNNDGSFVFLCAGVDDGLFSRIDIIGNIKNEEVTVSDPKYGVTALDMNYFENGNRVVFCTDSAVFENGSGESLVNCSYGADTCVLTYSNGTHALTVLDSVALGRENVLTVYTDKGQTLISSDVPTHPKSAYIYGEYAYVLYTDSIIRIDINRGEIKRCKNERVINTLLQTENGILLAVGKTRAYPIDNSKFE